jgi:hypothetical protein
VAINRSIKLKIHRIEVLSWCVCVCERERETDRQREIVQLFCVVFCVLTTLYKFDFRLDIKETTN